MKKVDTVYVRLGNKIRRLRREQRITQYELADWLDMTRCSIVNLEAGRQRISLHRLSLLASGLKTNPYELLRGCFPAM